jgi:hypothetical protein
MQRAVILLALPVLLLGADTARAAMITIQGNANIFAAGESSTGGVGTLPPFVSFASGTDLVLTFSSVTGIVSCCGGFFTNGPDGLSLFGTNINSSSGISGIVNSNAAMFLTGVFTDGTDFDGVAPPRLNFSNTALGRNFGSLSPLLFQTFFVGDGRTSTGAQQLFNVPSGATMLFLGFADAPGFSGNPGSYNDDTGFLIANLEIQQTTPIPEPATVVLLGTGLAAVVARRARRKK